MLKAVNLTKAYGSHTALDHLNLEIQAGEIYCLLGSNGAGKSTTINLFLGFIPATSGQAFIDGVEVSVNNQPPAIWWRISPKSSISTRRFPGWKIWSFSADSPAFSIPNRSWAVLWK
ncbi:ATP-binding cassette domain-containing protein [Siphonobacter sp. BAB-5385]|uniref:ATP-binding cassette domain-containing protein n=1 Tax=Siphonobacter sp. BAB-5385 TaxID=1864822 RepID=UPI0034E93ABA